MKVAAIDIGTNTILMLIAEVDEHKNVIPIQDFHEIARLGEGLNSSSVISENAFKRAVEILRKYVNFATQYEVEKIICVGTAVFREAKNSSEIINKIKIETGIDVKIIEGDLEAFLSFIGTVSDNNYSVVIDIGGGSTEIIAGKENKIIFRKSLPLGAVKITENFFPKHPPSSNELKRAYQFIDNEFVKISNLTVEGNIYAVAGTPTTLAAVVQGLKSYNREKIENYNLTYEQILWAKNKFLELTLQEIVDKFHVPPLRADVILAGTIILEKFCENFALNKVLVSDKGLRYGVAKYFFQNNKNNFLIA